MAYSRTEIYSLIMGVAAFMLALGTLFIVFTGSDPEPTEDQKQTEFEERYARVSAANAPTEDQKQTEFEERYARVSAANAPTEEERRLEFEERYMQVMLNGMHDVSGEFVDFAGIDLESEVVRGDATSRIVVVGVSMKYIDTLEGIRELFQMSENESLPEGFATPLGDGTFVVDGSAFEFSLAPAPGFIGPKNVLITDRQRNAICSAISKAYRDKFIFTFTARQIHNSDAASEVVFEGSASDLCSSRGFTYYKSGESIVFSRPAERVIDIDTDTSALVVARTSSLLPGGKVYIAKHSALDGELVVATAEFESIYTQDNRTFVILNGSYKPDDLGSPAYYVRRVSDKESQVVFIGALIGGNSSTIVVMPAEDILEGLSDVIPHELAPSLVDNNV